tara:strand:- start:50 stop:1237 length:1188 start_codon:yes stop_codon:yes gene_type:complete
MAGMSFEDYVNAYYRGGLDVSARYGIRKDDLKTEDTAYFNTMYGATVFNQLNTKSDVFKLFRKEGWTQSGWRVLSARTAAASNIGIAEGDAFGTSDVPDLVQIEADIKEIVSPYTVSTRAAMLSEADDGIKGLSTFLRAQAAEAHSFYIDAHLCADPATAAPQATEVNFTPLMRIAGNATQLTLAGTAAGEMDLYNIDRDASVGAGFEYKLGYVDNGSISGGGAETERPLTLALLDAAIQNAIENGASYDNLIFLMGHQQLTELKQLITNGSGNATWRMALEAQAPKGTNGVQSEPGMNLEGRMGYYDSIPIYATQHLATALTDQTGGSGTGMGPVLLLDMENLYMKIAAPTTFLAQEDLANVQALKRNYAFMTAGEIICTKMPTQGLIRGLEQA